MPKSIYANSFTALNLFAGFYAIISVHQNNIEFAVYLIIAAALFDALDGAVARLAKTSSRFGVEFDSLADAVSFGAAPSFLAYQTCFAQFNFWGVLISSAFLIAGVSRLARFNIKLKDIDKKEEFQGLPIPLAALTLSFFIYSFYENRLLINEYIWVPALLLVILSILMVSQIKYVSFSQIKNFPLLSRLLILVWLITSAAGTIFTQGYALFYVFFSIVLFGIFRHTFYFFTQCQKSN